MSKALAHPLSQKTPSQSLKLEFPQFNPVGSKDDLGFNELDQKIADMKRGAATLAHNAGRNFFDLQQYQEAIEQFLVAIDLVPENL